MTNSNSNRKLHKNVQMGIRYPFFKKYAKKSQQEVVITPTYIPLEWLNAYISDGLGANQKKFLELYLSVPELQAIINYKARVFAGGRIKAVDKNGDELKVQQTDLFAKPNPLQNFKEFAVQYYILRAIFGNEFIHPVFGNDKTKTVALWNLPPMNTEVVPIKNNLIPFNMTEIDELIKKYVFWYNGTRIEYTSDEIIHFNDNQVQFDNGKMLLGDSKLRPLTQACENIKNAYEARGVLIYNSALGILSNESTDAQGTVDIDEDEKERLQEDYKEKYGLSRHKWQLILTNARLKWESMAVDVGKLKLYEEVDSDFRAIANAHSFPPELLQPRPGSALNPGDKSESLKQLYQEAIIPEFDEFLQGIANWMQLDYMLKGDFSHIAALQEDRERASKSLNWAATGLAKAVEKEFITTEDATEEFKKYLI